MFTVFNVNSFRILTVSGGNGVLSKTLVMALASLGFSVKSLTQHLKTIDACLRKRSWKSCEHGLRMAPKTHVLVQHACEYVHLTGVPHGPTSEQALGSQRIFPIFFLIQVQSELPLNPQSFQNAHLTLCYSTTLAICK